MDLYFNVPVPVPSANRISPHFGSSGLVIEHVASKEIVDVVLKELLLKTRRDECLTHQIRYVERSGSYVLSIREQKLLENVIEKVKHGSSLRV